MFGRKRERAGSSAARQANDLSFDEIDDGSSSKLEGQPATNSTAAGVAVTGPWDSAALPDDGIARVDLGGLLMPVLDGSELRIDVDQATGALVSATLATQNSVMQVLAFAAPRTAGIWADVRREIVESIRTSGGKADVIEGKYGPEIVAEVPTETPGQVTPSRFLGADGPRWFLRALIQGEAAITPSAEPVLQQAFGLIGVARGDEAMAVRDALPLRLPKELQQPTGTPADGPGDDSTPAPRTLPERGPLNTETR